MKKVFYVCAILACVFLASCSSGRYLQNSSNVNLNQTQVVLSQANFKVVKNVKTTVLYKKTLKFDEAQLQQSAYAALVREANLTGSQTIINITIEQIQRVSGFFIPAEDNAVLVSGTVIEFIK